MERDLKNHAHDSIGCCCSDKVHREIVARFELAEDMADNLLRFYMRKIADNMPQSDADKLVLFNLMPWPRKKLLTPLCGCAPASLIYETIAVSLYRILFAMPVRSIQA